MNRVVLISLTRQTREVPARTRLIGQTDTELLARTRLARENNAWTLAAGYLTPAQIAEFRDLIDTWRIENPDQRFVANVRMVAFVAFVAFVALVAFVGRVNCAGPAARKSGGIFSLLFLDPLAGIDPGIRELEQTPDLGERIFFSSQRIQTIFILETEAIGNRVLAAPNLTYAVRAFSAFSDNTGRFTDATRQFSRIVEDFSDNLPEQRRDAIAQSASAEGAGTLADLNTRLTAERQATLADVAKRPIDERTATLGGNAKRLATERLAATDQLAEAVRLVR